MAIFQPCPGIAEVAIQFQDSNGDLAENILHVSNGGTAEWTATDLQTLANTVDTWLTTGSGGGHNLVAYLQSSFEVVNVATRDLTIQAGAEYIKGVSHVGLDTAARMAAGITKALTLRSGLAGRSQRGRVFLVGLSVSNQDSGNPDLMGSADIAVQEGIWTALISAISGAHSGWAWVVLSRFTNGGRRADGVGTPITGVGVSNNYFDYQRRRAPFHGRHH